MSAHPQLAALRRIWNGCVTGLVVLASALTSLASSASTLPAILPLGLAAAVGVAAVCAVIGVDRVFAASPPESDELAVRQLRGRLVVQAAIAWAAVLVGTLVAFAFGPRWSVIVGAMAALVALLRIRPSWDRLARFDAAWCRTHRDVSLRRALRPS